MRRRQPGGAVALLLAWSCVQLFASAPLARATTDYPVRARKTVSLDLPDVALAAKPLDSALRVVLCLSSPRGASNASFPEVGDQRLVNGHMVVTSVDMISVDFASAFYALAERSLRRLFPQLQVCPADLAARSYDLLLIMGISSRVVDNADGTFRGFEVQGSIYLADGTGSHLDSIEAVGHADATKTHYWSGTSRSKAIGTPALQNAHSLLFSRLLASAPLKAYLDARTAERERPPGLATTAAFDDHDAVMPNGRLDAGETAPLLFTVRSEE